MYVVSVTIWVKPQWLADFIEATLDNATNTRKEPGNVRFDVLQGEGEPTRFALYEAYHSKDDFGKHHLTEHYLRWKQKVADYMSKPREGAKYVSLFFKD